MTNKHKWPLGQKYEGGEEYTPDSGIEVVQPFPDPEIKGTGTVLDANGNIKEDKHGGDIIGSGGKCCGQRSS